MGIFYIAFESEVPESIPLIDEDKSDIIEQLEQRRHAVSQIDEIIQLSDTDKNTETLIRESTYIGTESNNTINVLTKSILRGIKEVGYANENITAILINRANTAALIGKYITMYQSDEYNLFIAKLCTLVNDVIGKDVCITISDVVDPDKINIDDVSVDNIKGSYNLQLYINKLPDLIKTVLDVNINLKKKIDNLSDGSYNTWNTDDISDIDNQEIITITQNVIDLNIQVSNSIAKIYNILYNELENDTSGAKDEVIQLRDAHQLYCQSLEQELIVDKTVILERYKNDLLAIESFRDTVVGRVLAKTFNFVSSVFKSVILVLAGVISEIVERFYKVLVSGITTDQLKATEQRLTQVMENVVNKFCIDFDHGGSEIMFYNKEHKPQYYRIDGSTLAASLVEEDPKTKIQSNFKVVSFSNLYDIFHIFYGVNIVSHTAKGLITTSKIALDIATNGVNSIGDYRDVIMKYINDKSKSDCSILANTLNNILIKISKESIWVFNESDNTNTIDISNKISEAIHTISGNDVDASVTYCNEIIDLIKELTVLSDTRGAYNTVQLYNKNDTTNIGVLKTGALMLRNAVKKAEVKFKNIDKILDNIKDNTIDKDRVTIAKAYTKAICAASRISLTIGYNSLNANAKLERIRQRSLNLSIRFINMLYAEFCKNK